jgi:hypothetical protein
MEKIILARVTADVAEADFGESCLTLQEAAQLAYCCGILLRAHEKLLPGLHSAELIAAGKKFSEILWRLGIDHRDRDGEPRT